MAYVISDIDSNNHSFHIQFNSKVQNPRVSVEIIGGSNPRTIEFPSVREARAFVQTEIAGGFLTEDDFVFEIEDRK